MPRTYIPVGQFYGLIVPDEVTVFECSDDGLAVVDTDLHEQWHNQTRIIGCRCPRVGEPAPEYFFCQVHDRASYPQGEPIRGER